MLAALAAGGCGPDARARGGGDRQRLHRRHGSSWPRQHGVRRIALHPAAQLRRRRSTRRSPQTGGEAVLLLNADCFLRAGFLAAALARLARTGRRLGGARSCFARRDPVTAAPGPRRSTPPGWCVDRRRKNGLVGHGRSAAQPTRAARRPSVPTGRPRCTGARRSSRLPPRRDARCLTRTWRCGPRTRTSPVARSCSGGAACTSRRRSPITCARTARAPARRSVSAIAEIQFRNRYLMMIKNETVASLAGDLVPILGYELLAFGHVLVRERHLLGAYAELPAPSPAGAGAPAGGSVEWSFASAPFGLRVPCLSVLRNSEPGWRGNRSGPLVAEGDGFWRVRGRPPRSSGCRRR